MKKLGVFGIGGFGRESMECLIDEVQTRPNVSMDDLFYVVSDEYYNEDNIRGIQIITESTLIADKHRFAVAIGDPKLRQDVVERLSSEFEFLTIIHPSVILSDSVMIGDGSIITAGCILTCDIKVGVHAHLNLHTTIGHDCVIGNYFTTAPGVHISGNCLIGDNVYFGTNSAVKQGIKICSGVTIGMGAVVTKDIEKPGIYTGIPAKKQS